MAASAVARGLRRDARQEGSIGGAVPSKQGSESDAGTARPAARHRPLPSLASSCRAVHPSLTWAAVQHRHVLHQGGQLRHYPAETSNGMTDTTAGFCPVVLFNDKRHPGAARGDFTQGLSAATRRGVSTTPLPRPPPPCHCRDAQLREARPGWIEGRAGEAPRALLRASSL